MICFGDQFKRLQYGWRILYVIACIKSLSDKDFRQVCLIIVNLW